MNENNNSNNNMNYVESMKWNGIDFTGPHTVMHHQCYQMVDMLMHHCRRAMCGLNPHALPHEPKYQVDINEM